MRKCRPKAWVGTALVFLFLLLAGLPGFAHEVRPAYLELHQTAPETYDVLWKVPGLGENLRLGLYLELPASCTNLTEPRPAMANNAFTERWTVSCPGGEQVCIGSVRITAAQAKAARATKKSKRVLVGAKRYRLKGGEKKKIVVKINGRGVRLVRKRHRLPVKATFKTKDKAGNVSTRVQVFNLHESAFRHN